MSTKSDLELTQQRLNEQPSPANVQSDAASESAKNAAKYAKQIIESQMNDRTDPRK